MLEGGTEVIDTAELQVTDVDLPAQTLTYTLVTDVVNGSLRKSAVDLTASSTFTQADVDANNIDYVHDGGETTSDSFEFTVSDGNGGTIGSTTFNITITPQNDTPVLAVNTGATVLGGPLEVIENTELLVTDIDLPPQTLTYALVTDVTNGSLRRLGVDLTVSSTFTQADIDLGRIDYLHDGSEATGDSFEFTVSDGNGGTIPSTAFDILIPRRTITAIIIGAGSVTPNAATVYHGASTNFLIDADAHYHIESIRTNSQLLTGYPYNNGFAATNVNWPDISANGTIEAVFAANLWTNDTPEPWLAIYYPTTNSYRDAALSDTDGDSLTAWQEYVVGSDPTNAESSFEIVEQGFADGSNYVKWLSYTNWTTAPFGVERRTNLLAGAWEPVDYNLARTPPTNIFRELNPYPGIPAFYRLIITNAP